MNETGHGSSIHRREGGFTIGGAALETENFPCYFMGVMEMREKYGPFALVAGGSEGLGAAWAGALAKRGFNLVLLARRKALLEGFAAELREKYPVTVITGAVDLAGFDAVRAFVGGLDAEIGLLVYNAAEAPTGFFADIEAERLERVALVNVRGPLLLARLLIPGMITRKRGGIILMSSLAGTAGSPRLAGYAASKAFNAVLAEGLREELRPQGIDVISCVAGAILTPGYQQTQRGNAPGIMTAEAVAEKTLAALGRGPVVVPGAVNKIARFLMMRLMPRTAAVKIMAGNTKTLKGS